MALFYVVYVDGMDGDLFLSINAAAEAAKTALIYGAKQVIIKRRKKDS